MDANKVFGAEPFCNTPYTFTQQIVVLADVDLHVVGGFLDPVDFLDVQKNDLPSGPDHHSVFVLKLRFVLLGKQIQNMSRQIKMPGFQQFGFGSLDGTVQSFLLEWLQQIIEGMSIECANRKLII